MRYEKSKVVILPTEKVSKIWKNNSTGKLAYVENEKPNIAMRNTWTPQHLYFLSDEEIKEGDVVLHNFGMGYLIENPCDIDNLKSNTRFKIIATTDKLRVGPFMGFDTETGEDLSDFLPRPSNEFLKKYCELGGIDEVLVDYDEYSDGERDSDGYPLSKYKPKVAPDNTITIKPIKDSWSREEVTSLIHKAIYELTMPNGEPEFVEGYEINNWIEKNL